MLDRRLHYSTDSFYVMKAFLTHLLWSETTSGLLGSRNILGKDRIAPDGSPTKQRHNISQTQAMALMTAST